MADKYKFRIRDNDQAPDVFADQFLGVQFNGSTFTVTVGAVRALPEKTGADQTIGAPVAVVTGRLVLTPNAATDLMKGLGNMIATVSKPTDPKQAN